jgi:tetratricopeptide (TPR) repeat protein
MKQILYFLISIFPVLAICQTTERDSVPVQEQEIYTIVEMMPTFPGGEQALFQFLNDNLNFPKAEKERGLGGVVYTSFVIDAEGNVTKPQILKGIANGAGFSEEALKILSLMPKWNPGMQNGQYVSVQFNLPIKWTNKINPAKNNLEAVSLDENYIEACKLVTQKKYPEAIEKLNTAIANSGKNPLYLFERAYALYAIGHTDFACKDWETIINSTSQNEVKQKATDYIKEFCKQTEVDSLSIQEEESFTIVEDMPKISRRG